MMISKASLSALVLTALLWGSLEAQTVGVKGKINDPKGNPVIFASVRVKNSRLGASSDSSGVFTIGVRPNDSLLVTAVGFNDTILSVGDRSTVSIVLTRRATALHEAVVTAATEGPDPSSQMEATRDEIIANAFQDYARGAMYSNGAYTITSYNPGAAGAGGMTNTKIPGFGPLNTLNSGAMLPVVHHQEDTRGSRYLLKDFVIGTIVDKDGHVMTDSVTLINYDKMDGQLLIAQGEGNYLEVDKEKVIAFGMKTPDTSFVFVNVPVLSKFNYFLLIANGPKYSAYKSLKTKFSKANYVSNGLTESGHNYDEYVDKETYFWLKGTDSAGLFELKKKSSKAAFAGDNVKVDAFFSQHKYDDMDDSFVRKLIVYLNKP